MLKNIFYLRSFTFVQDDRYSCSSIYPCHSDERMRRRISHSVILKHKVLKNPFYLRSFTFVQDDRYRHSSIRPCHSDERMRRRISHYVILKHKVLKNPFYLRSFTFVQDDREIIHYDRAVYSKNSERIMLLTKTPSRVKA